MLPGHKWSKKIQKSCNNLKDGKTQHTKKKKKQPCRGKPIEDVKHYVITGKQTTYFQTTEQRAIYDRSKGHTFSHCQVNLQEGMTAIIVKVLL